MDQEVLLALIFKRIEKRLNDLYLPSRGPRGQRGQRGEQGKSGKDFVFEEHAEQIKSIVQDSSLKFEDLTPEQIDNLRGPRGRDGVKGRDGKDFNFSEHEEAFKSWAKEFALKFEDFTAEQVNSITGPAGRDGRDGKSFNFSEHEETFKSWAREFALKFEDLTVDQIDRLRGPRGRDGRDGRDGKDFNFSEHSEEIRGWVQEFSLKFADLTADEIEKLRGPRGRDGKDGKGFIFEEHAEFFQSLRPKFSDFTEEERNQLVLRFSHLTEEEKSQLKLRFEDLSDEDRLKLRGARGTRGQRGAPGRDGENGKDGLSIQGVPGLPGIMGRPGRDGLNGLDGSDGRDGEDGKDAPYITDIKIDQYKHNEFEFIFEFSDGTSVRSEKVKLPTPNVYSSAGGGGVSSNSGGGGGDVSVLYEGVEVLSAASSLDFVGEGVLVEDAGGGVATITISSGGDGSLGIAKKDTALTGTFSAGNTEYTLSHTPVSNQVLSVWLNGVLREDYVLAGNKVTFAFDTTTQVFDAQYRYLGTATGTAKKDISLSGVYASGDTTYTLTEEPTTPDELVVYLNGAMRTDYTLVGDVVTFSGQDTTSQAMDAHYRYSSTAPDGPEEITEVPTGIRDGSNDEFFLSQIPVDPANKMKLYQNGVYFRYSPDNTFSNGGQYTVILNKIIMAAPPTPSQNLDANYWY